MKKKTIASLVVSGVLIAGAYITNHLHHQYACFNTLKQLEESTTYQHLQQYAREKLDSEGDLLTTKRILQDNSNVLLEDKRILNYLHHKKDSLEKKIPQLNNKVDSLNNIINSNPEMKKIREEAHYHFWKSINPMHEKD